MSYSNIILGAGFSKSAGLPVTSEMDSLFQTNVRNSILRFGSQEFKWAHNKDDANLTNGRIGPDHLCYGYILEEIVATYIRENDVFENYAGLYQYVLDKLESTEFWKELYERAKENCLLNEEGLKNNAEIDQWLYPFGDYNSRATIIQLLNDLIADALNIPKSRDEILIYYSEFIHMVTENKSNLFTLNHDRLVEALFNLLEVNYDDGFNSTSSNLINDSKNNLRIFQSNFGDQVNLIKLHGSRDIYRFDHTEKDGLVNRYNGEYTYFKTAEYRDYQLPKRIDPTTKDILQDFNPNITPQFLTGKNKKEIIASDYMYSSVYKKLELEIIESESLLIIGYSFMDEHINDVIKEAITGKLKKILNINPSIRIEDHFDMGKCSFQNIGDLLEGEF